MGDPAGAQLAQAHEQRINGNYDQALSLYRQILEAQDDHAEALWGLGLCLMTTGEFDDALASLQCATEIEPDNQQYLLDVGKHYAMLGMYDEARPLFEKIREIDPSSQEGAEAQKQLSYY